MKEKERENQTLDQMRKCRSKCENKVCYGRNKRTIGEKREIKSEKVIRDTGVHIERAESVGIEKKDGISQKKR